MITRTAEYALRAAVYLGNHHGVPRTATNISQAINVPVDRLAMVMWHLRRGQIVHSQFGPHGGFTLARDSNELTVLEVIQSVDALQRFTECPLGSRAHASELCPLHQRLDELMAAAESELHEAAIRELLDGANGNNSCQYPCISESTNSSKTRSDTYWRLG